MDGDGGGVAASGLAREAGAGSCPGASAATGGEMSAELVSSALGLALYLNTLGADFCYDDRYDGPGHTCRRWGRAGRLGVGGTGSPDRRCRRRGR